VPKIENKPVEVRKPELNPEDDDFWSRLKAKIRGGQVTPGTEGNR
jgi:hypothetical protein